MAAILGVLWGSVKSSVLHIYDEDSLELRMEITKSLINFQDKLFKTFYDRRTIAERYFDGSIAMRIHMIASKDCFCYARVNRDDDRTLNHSEVAVLVWVGEGDKEVTSIGV